MYKLSNKKENIKELLLKNIKSYYLKILNRNNYY